MLVVIGVIGITIPILFLIFFTILQQEARIYALQEVKKEGDLALLNISNTLKNSAKKIYTDNPPSPTSEHCGPTDTVAFTGNALYFTDNNNLLIGYSIDSTSKIASISSNITYLTSDKVVVKDFTIGCNRTQEYSPPIVSLSFSVGYSTNTAISLQYQTKIKLLTY